MLAAVCERTNSIFGHALSEYRAGVKQCYLRVNDMLAVVCECTNSIFGHALS